MSGHIDDCLKLEKEIMNVEIELLNSIWIKIKFKYQAPLNLS